jgi:hypothetical protein
MAPRSAPPHQLDIPLVWDRDRQGPAQSGAPGAAPGPAVPASRVGLMRLWVGVLADVGVVLLAIGGAWATAALSGAGLRPAQLLAAAIAGLEASGVLAVSCLWIWRGSPGMLLLKVCFAQPMPMPRAFRLWLAWLASFVLAGTPLLLGRRGPCVAERLAGADLSFRPTPGNA